MPELQATYEVACHRCRAVFDAHDTPWCSCLVTERTLVCPHCLSCFCSAPPAYKQAFWSKAPKTLWDIKFQEHNAPFEVPANPEPDAAKRPLVLVVDDEPNILMVAARAVQSLGYGLVIARNGAEGLELAGRYRPNLVLTDALMPKLDGRDMGRMIKDDPATAQTVVIVMTALYTGIKYVNEAAKRYKADEYVSKPLQFARLREMLQRHLPESAD